MGLLIDGVWQDQWYDTKSTGGAFKREASQFHHQITADGHSGFLAETNRYHLYVSLACPWAHRTLIMRQLKNLTDHISLSIVDPYMGENGWQFGDSPDTIPDTINGKQYLHQIYTLVDASYTGRVTVPILWDKQKQTIVNNESADIIRQFNRAFVNLADDEVDYYPEPLQTEIDDINQFVYKRVNNGVYNCGFATSQAAYERALDSLFAALDELNQRLEHQQYLVGNTLTEADIRLYTTLIRFDCVYVGHFKCNLRRIQDYANLFSYLKRLYALRAFQETTNFTHIKRHYYESHATINPTGIVPKGPVLNLD